MRTLFMLLSAACACASACGPSNALPIDAPIVIDAAPDAHPPDAAPPSTVAQLRRLRPADGYHISLSGLVVVARVSSAAGGNLWVQDAGGGPYSGIRVFCNYTGSAPRCPMARTAFDALALGSVVDLGGTFAGFTGAGAPAGTEPQLQIDVSMLTATGGNMAPAALDVAAVDLASDHYAAGSTSDPYKGAYVRVTGAASFTASDVAPAELAAACTDRNGATGSTYAGFHLAAGATTLDVALGFHDTLTYCIPCSGVGNPYPCNKPVATNETFTAAKGIVEPSYNGSAKFLALSPVLDTDLPP